jgi:hypothetical protein
MEWLSKYKAIMQLWKEKSPKGIDASPQWRTKNLATDQNMAS